MSSNFFVEEPGPSQLLHYGVKGMQWGVRKAHPTYHPTQQHADREKFGKRGVKRINKRLNRGKTHERASQIERRNQIIKRSVRITAGSVIAAQALHVIGSAVVGGIIGHRVAQAGFRAAETALSESHGLPGGGFINLSFNATKNLWE